MKETCSIRYRTKCLDQKRGNNNDGPLSGRRGYNEYWWALVFVRLRRGVVEGFAEFAFFHPKGKWHVQGRPLSDMESQLMHAENRH